VGCVWRERCSFFRGEKFGRENEGSDCIVRAGCEEGSPIRRPLGGLEVVYADAAIITCVLVVLAWGLSVWEFAFPQSRFIDGAAVGLSCGGYQIGGYGRLLHLVNWGYMVAENYIEKLRISLTGLQLCGVGLWSILG